MEPKPLSAYQNLNDQFVELCTFGQLPPNTSIHKDRYNRFIPTGGGSLWGGQTIANLVKGHTSDKLAKDISDFVQSLIQSLDSILQQAESSNDHAFRNKIFRQVVLVNREISYAISKEGGLQGLMATYKDVQPSLHDSIQKMKKQAADALVKIYVLLPAKDKIPENLLSDLIEEPKAFSPCLPYCPEEFFTDEEWEEAIANSLKLRAECVSLAKYAAYSITLQLSDVISALNIYSASTIQLLGIEWKSDWQWWNKIITLDNGTSLYLGALPLEKGAFGYIYRNDLAKLQKEGIGAILSVVQKFENISEGTISSPITPLQWKEAGIKQLQLPTPDFETISFELILKGVEFIHWNLKNGRSICVHCKAGHGRSFLIEMCYLMKYHNLSATQALALLRSKRSHAGFSEYDPKMKSALKFEQLLKEKNNKVGEESE